MVFILSQVLTLINYYLISLYLNKVYVIPKVYFNCIFLFVDWKIQDLFVHFVLLDQNVLFLSGDTSRCCCKENYEEEGKMGLFPKT